LKQTLPQLPDKSGERAAASPRAFVDRPHHGDNLDFLHTLPDACCNLIYIDPPFDLTGALVNSLPAREPRWSESRAQAPDARVGCFLSFLRPRILQMHRVLAETGSIYVHLDWRTAHYVKVLLDELFGPEQFLNEIIWSYRTGSRPGPWFPRKHDTLLLYAKYKGRHAFNPLRGGDYRTKDLRLADDGRPYKSTRRGRLYFHPDGPLVSDVWEIPFLSTVSKQRVGYASQKPEALLERVIEASSNPDDLVADFFCGSGTTLVVAKRMGRRFLGCDINPEAVAIAQRRLATVRTRE
jgi:site-specific DNA-methyltransferase (adenine-specific)